MEKNKKLINILKKLFKGSNFKKKIKEVKLKDLKGWDSLKHFHLLLEVEKKFNIRFSPETFNKIKNIKDIMNEITKNGK